MSSVVAVAGGSGGLGRAIVEAAKADKRNEVVILGRKTNPALEQETGVRVLAADYSNVDSLVSLFESNNISTVISVVNVGMDNTAEMNLVAAAGRSKTTRRLIPNVYSAIDYQPEHLAEFPIAALRFQARDAVKKTDLEWTSLYPGIFMDYFVPGLPTHVNRYPMFVDVDNNAAGIPGTGNEPAYFTWTHDIGRYIAALLTLPKWDEKYFIVGDNRSWNSIVEIAEKKKGVKFDVHHDPVEKLKTGQVTELPGHHKAYAMFGGEAAKPMVQGMMAKFGVWYATGVASKYEGAKFLNELFPDIKPLTVEEAWAKYYKA